jgi:aryl-phospho-beta-D-glucosidase BglC (GH1 family)
MTYYGFNFQWMFSFTGQPAPPPNERALDFLAAQGFNFVRLPMDYRFWTRGTDYFIPDDSVWRIIDTYIAACRSRGLHVSLNLHRAPGYCINKNQIEKHNLWVDEVAQEAFLFLWKSFAKRFDNVPAKELSFDLLNEPPEVGDYGLTRENHAELIRRAVAVIREITPDRLIQINGLAGGHLALPELADLDVIHSSRGYQPMAISHYQAHWWPGNRSIIDIPSYPNYAWQGTTWNKSTLREFYQSWREVQAQGRTIHIGEFGCYNQIPNPTALTWLSDLLSLYKEFGWGYCLWNFEGPFGIINHGRSGAQMETIQGYQVDRQLLNLLLNNRVEK